MTHKLRVLHLLPLLAFVASTGLSAAEIAVVQKDKKFSTAKLSIKVGDTVSFKNDDPFAHNVFSLSDSKSFDLGSYPKGQSRTVTFDKPGVVEIECAIHPDMKLSVEVKK